MGIKKETTEVEVNLRTAEAEARIKELGKQYEIASAQLAKMGKDDPGRAKLKADINAIAKEVVDLNKSIKKDLTLVIDGKEADGNVKELKTAQAQLTREVEVFRDKTDPIYKYKAEQLEQVSARLKDMQAPIIDAKKGFVDLGEEGSLARLETRAKELNDELNKLNPASEKAKKNIAELAVVEKTINETKQATAALKAEFVGIGQVGSFTWLKTKAEDLRKEIDRLTPDTEQFIAKSRELQQVDNQMARINTTIKGTGGLWNGLTQSVKQFGLLAASYLGFQAITSQVQNIISKNAQLSDSIADVMQTTGMTKEEVNQLNKELKNLDTRTSRQELLEIAKVAGQFGVAKDQIIAFTQAVNKTAVVLKSEFKGGAEEITTTLAGLRNVLTDIKSENIDQDLLHLGNGLIKLAQEGVATAPVVADFANRIGGIGISLGLTSGQVLGLSATLQELSVSSERGGTAIGKILQKMTTNVDEFAKVAGYDGTAGRTVKEFARLVDTDIYSALLQFVEGTTKSKEGAIAFANILKDSEISGAGASEVISKLAANLPLLQQRVQLAGNSIKETTAIQEQYNIKNQNFAAQLSILGQRLGRFFASPAASEFFARMTSGLNSLLDTTPKFEILIREFNQLKESTNNLEKNIAPLLERYDELTSKTTRTTDENAELEKIILKVSIAIPTATSAVDQYGKALGLNTERAKAFIKAQQDLTSFKNADVIKETEKAIHDYTLQIEYTTKKMNEMLKTGKTQIATGSALQPGGKAFQEVEVKQQDILSIQNQLTALNTSLEGTKLKLRELKGLPLIDDNSSPKKEIVTKVTTEGVEKVKADLNKLTDEQKKQLKEHEKAVADHNAKIKALLEQLKTVEIDSIRDFGEKEIALLDQKHENEQNEIKENLGRELDNEQLNASQKQQLKDASSKLLLAQEQKYFEDRNKLVFKYSQELTDAELNQDIQNLQEWASKRTIALTTALNEEKITREEYENSITELDRRVKQQSLALEEQYYNASLSNLEQATNAAKADLVERYTSGKITEEEFAAQSKTLQETTDRQKTEISKKFNAAILDGKQALADAEAGIDNGSVQKFINREQQKLQLQLNVARDGSLKQLDAQKAAIEAERQQRLAFYKNDAEMRVLINADAEKQIQAAEQAHLEKLLQQLTSIYGQFRNTVGSYFNYLATKENNELARDRAANDAKKNNLKKQLDGKRIDQADYDAAMAKMEEQQRVKELALRKKQFQRDKAFKIVDAIISAAAAAVQAWNAAGGNPYIYAAIAALISASATAEIATIASTEPPEYETGKRAFVWPGKGGKPTGPSHKDGGIDLVDTQTKQTIGNMEGDEPILSKKTYLNNRPLVDKLLDSSLNKGGEKIKLTDNDLIALFEKGGFLNPPESDTKQEQNIFENYLNSLGAVMALEIPPEAKAALIQKLSIISTTENEKSRFDEVFKLQQYTETIAGARNQFSNQGGNISSTLDEFGLQVRLLANTTSKRSARNLVNDALNKFDIPEKKQVNPGLNKGPGTQDPADPSDQRGLVNLYSNKFDIPEKKQVNPGLNKGPGTQGPADPSDQRGLVNIFNNRGTGVPGPKEPSNQRGLVNDALNRGTLSTDYIDQLLARTAVPSYTPTPVFTPASVPQLNTGRILENMHIERFGYAAATGKLPEQVQPPVKQDPNSNQRVTTDPFQQERLKSMETMNDLLRLNARFLTDPKMIQAQISLQEFKRIQKLDEQVRGNSRVG